MERAVIVCLIISIILRIILGYIQKDIWKIKTYKYWIIVPAMTLVGVLGAKTASWIAYGRFSGTRLYGTVLAIAIFGAVLAILLCIPYEQLYGFSSGGTWLAVTVMKVPCIIDGCCAGKVMYVDGNGKSVLFPSQIVETVVAAIIFAWFFILGKSNYPHGRLFPLAMIWYGIYRYAFDFLRGHPLEQSPFVLWIPAGRFFSLLILIIGLVAMYLVMKKEKNKVSVKDYILSMIGKE